MDNQAFLRRLFAEWYAGPFGEGPVEDVTVGENGKYARITPNVAFSAVLAVAGPMLEAVIAYQAFNNVGNDLKAYQWHLGCRALGIEEGDHEAHVREHEPEYSEEIGAFRKAYLEGK